MLWARPSGDIGPTSAASSHSGAAFKVHFSLPGTLGDMGLEKWPIGPLNREYFLGAGKKNEFKENPHYFYSECFLSNCNFNFGLCRFSSKPPIQIQIMF